MDHIIKIKELYKSYGEIKAVKNLSFDVKKGELFAFLGVNGAGKSTVINIMCGQLKKDSGKIEIGGMDIDEKADDIKRKLGVVFQNSALDKPLSVWDNLESRGVLYGISANEIKARIKYLADLLDIGNLLKRPYGKLSGGQARRIDIARALLCKPDILILDEPTTGLDPQTRQRIWGVIDTLRKNENTTVFLTTHYMEEASDADYVVILDSGEIAAEGTPLELKNRYTGDFITLYGVSEEEIKTLGVNYSKNKDSYKVFVPATNIATELIVKHPLLFRDYEITKGRMDDVFLAATGKSLSDFTATEIIGEEHK